MLRLRSRAPRPVTPLLLILVVFIFDIAHFTTTAFAPLAARKNHARAARQQSAILTGGSTALGIAKSGGRMIATTEEFETFVLAKDSPRPVLAFFSAPWCGPCRLTNPVVKEIMKQYAGDIDTVEICTDDLAEVASNAGVTSIPTIQFYHSGTILDTIVGCVAKSVLANAVEKVLEDTKVVQPPPSSSS